MREILFRGKRKDNGEWVEGADVMHKTVRGELCLANVGVDWVSVDPLTCGQYTDLTDSNGAKIFEGDIVKLTDNCNDFEWKAVVVFGNPDRAYCWGWNFVPIDEYKGTTDILLWVEMEDSGAYCEVIGNIYDNPELLKNNNLEEHKNGQNQHT